MSALAGVESTSAKTLKGGAGPLQDAPRKGMTEIHQEYLNTEELFNTCSRLLREIAKHFQSRSS